MDSNRFPLQNAIKKILDNPSTRPVLPVLKDSSSTGDGSSVGDKNFGKAAVYDTGTSPSIALNNENVVVEVHKSENHDTLWYRVGRVEGGRINWEKNNGKESTEYDKGVQPSVAITNDGLVIEVHKSQTEGEDTLWYHVGKVNGDKITFGKSHNYDKGVQPSVAITNDGLVIEVHKSQTEGEDTLWYRIGTVKDDTNTIEWQDNKNNKNKKSTEYDKGVQPSVAITNDGLVVEVHKSQNHDTLWYHVGRVNDDNTITGFNDKSKNYSNGTVPKVACNGALAVETHNEGKDKLLSSVLTLPAFHPQWYEDRGLNSYCYFSMGTGYGPSSNERIATSKTITVDPGAPFLLANITQSRESIAFPTGAMLTIKGPDGIIYNQEESRGHNLVIKSGSSIQSLIIKEPIGGDYHITLTLPPHVAFFFAFETLPSRNLDGIIGGSQNLQKRDVNNNGNKGKQVAELLAMLWLIIYRERQSLLFLEEPVGYVTKSKVDILHQKLPTDLVQATDIIALPIYRILTVQDFRIPPARPTPAPINGPVIEFVRNQDGALLWLHAQIRPNDLNTGTPTNQAMRAFAQGLGLRTDDAGHVIGNRLGGLGTVEWNIFPQNPNFNRGAYSSYVEQVFFDAVRRYGPIEVWFRFHYNDPQHPNRPSSFDYCWRSAGGAEGINDLDNPENVPRGL